MNIYVGNLPYKCSDEDLQQAFADYGTVSKATVVRDKITGQSRGFGFVEMPNDEEARQALQALNGGDWQGRKLTVNEARPREEGSRPPRGEGFRRDSY